MTISGKGLIGQVPFDGRFVQDLPDNGPNPQEQALQDGLTEGIYITVAPRPVPPAQVTGQVTLSQAAVAEFFDWQPNQIMRALQLGDADIALVGGAVSSTCAPAFLVASVSAFAIRPPPATSTRSVVSSGSAR